jgi:uncharacterized protein (DUF58 family)
MFLLQRGTKNAYTPINTVILVVVVLCQLLYGGITVWLNMGHGPLLTLWSGLLLSRGYFFMLIVGLIFVSQTRALQLPRDIEPAAQEMPVQMAPPPA